ncbi:uncharacterized protein [Typha angustifolia]|uniref:uncharacterized protein n=1 Tax=Typha angustifolia TaxID=59011 RepID=UPI003C2AE3C6
MVVGFGRSISFPNPKTTPLNRTRFAAAKSASLPCRFHPLVVNLDDAIVALRSWAAAQPPTATWVTDGLAHLAQLLAFLADLLHHPQAQDPLRRLRGRSRWANRLLDDFLLLADHYASFRTALLGLKGLGYETHAAVRRGDPVRVASAVRSQRRSDRDLARLASAARDLARSRAIVLPPDASEAALSAAVRDAVSAVASASAAVFSGLAAISAASTDGASEPQCSPWVACPIPSPARFSTPMRFPTPARAAPKGSSTARVWWVVDLLRWRWRSKKRSGKKEEVEVDKDEEEEKERSLALERLEKLEECIVAVEISCEKVYRGLINTRVSLLNILTPTL